VKTLTLSALSLLIVSLFWISTVDRRNATKIIAAIEEYKGAHGKLPDQNDPEVMEELGFKLMAVDWFPDFQVGENGNYRMTILKGFDGPYWIYDSSTKSWWEGFDFIFPENK
jgi:hypothetical protein